MVIELLGGSHREMFEVTGSEKCSAETSPDFWEFFRIFVETV
jgi:hypothetical protein